jgi:hypothetical protein
MARIRTIKPQHVNDKKLTEISLQAHLFWVLSWCFSDDEGVMENDPILLKSQIFPRRTDIKTEQVEKWINELIKVKYVIAFQHNGENYLLHRTFRIHQKIDRPQPSKIPAETIRRIIDECSTNDQPCIVKDSIVEESSIGETPRTLTPDEIEFDDVVKWMRLKAPRVLKMKEPLTMIEYFKIKDKYGVECIPGILQDMHNWGKLNTKVSAYLTFLTFIKRKDAA